MNRGRGFSTDAGAAIRTTVRPCSAVFGGPRICPSRSAVSRSRAAHWLAGEDVARRGRVKERRRGTREKRAISLPLSLFLPPSAVCPSSFRAATKWEQQLFSSDTLQRHWLVPPFGQNSPVSRFSRKDYT